MNSRLFIITISERGTGLNVIAECTQPAGLYRLDLSLEDIARLPDLPQADFAKESDPDKRHALDSVYNRLALVPKDDDMELSISAVVEVPPQVKIFEKERNFGSSLYIVSIFEEGTHMCVTATHPTEGAYHTKVGPMEFRSISNFDSLEKLSLTQKTELALKKGP